VKQFIVQNRGKLMLATGAAAYAALGLITGDMDATTAATKFVSLVAALGLF
jgi:hypothetical protein